MSGESVKPAPKGGLAFRPELDAIRGVAILLVVLQHFVFIGVGNARLAVAGMAGVTLFFVLSGYLITSLLVAEHSRTGRVSLRGFYERRVRRLMPALVALVVVVTVVGLPGDPLVALLYLGNWANRLGWDIGYLTHTWTLGIEEQFYLVWPVLFVALARWRKVLVGVLVIAVVVSVIFRHDIGNAMRADPLGAGCLLALWGGRLPRWAGVAGWAALVPLCLLVGEPPEWAWTAIAGASALIVGSGVAPTLRSFVWLGEISYALYLWNYVVARLGNPVAVAFGPAGIVTWMVVGSALSVVIAAISTRYIERPFRLRLGDLDVRRGNRTSATSASLEGGRAGARGVAERLDGEGVRTGGWRPAE